MKALLPLLYRWHQSIGFYIALAIIAWGLSGLAHPIISRLNPKPVMFAAPAPALTLPAQFELATLLQQQSINTVERLRIFSWDNKSVARIKSEHGIQYFDLNSLSIIKDGNQQYAEYLARHYSGDHTSSVKNIETKTAFSNDYNYINRLLPIQRVQLDRDDGLRVYVDTDSGRLGTLSDDRKYITATLFRNLHSLVFIESLTLRTAIMMVFLTLGFIVSLAGLWLYIKLWRRGALNKKHTAGRRWHRSLGALVALAAMGFCFSGALHAWYKFSSTQTDNGMEASNTQLPTSFSSAQLHLTTRDLKPALQSQSISNIQLISFDSEPSWYINKRQAASHKHGEHQHNKKAQREVTLPVLYLNKQLQIIEQGGEKHAIDLASQLTSYPRDKASTATAVASFGGEYGFVNKRLPVYKIDYQLDGAPSVYIENSTHTLAASVNNSARVEGLSFAYIHKWHHLDFLGRNGRDIVIALFALGINITLILGLWRYCLQRGWLKSKGRKKVSASTRA